MGDEVKEHELEVSSLKKRNAQLQKEINLLKEIAEKEVENMKNDFQDLLLDENTNSTGPPLSARATIIGAGKKKKLRRSASRKEIKSREMAIPYVPPIEKFVEMMKASLLTKINHAQN